MIKLSGSRVYTKPPVPKMPLGLVELMNDLSKEVLRNNPPDVHVFCANHMLKLLEIRDGTKALVKERELKPHKKILSLEGKIKSAQEKVRLRAEERWRHIDTQHTIQNEQIHEISIIPDKIQREKDNIEEFPDKKGIISLHHEQDLFVASEVEIFHQADNINGEIRRHENITNDTETSQSVDIEKKDKTESKCNDENMSPDNHIDDINKPNNLSNDTEQEINIVEEVILSETNNFTTEETFKDNLIETKNILKIAPPVRNEEKNDETVDITNKPTVYKNSYKKHSKDKVESNHDFIDNEEKHVTTNNDNKNQLVSNEAATSNINCNVLHNLEISKDINEKEGNPNESIKQDHISFEAIEPNHKVDTESITSLKASVVQGEENKNHNNQDNETDNDCGVYAEPISPLKVSVIQNEDNKTHDNQDKKTDYNREAIDLDQEVYKESISSLKASVIQNENKSHDNQDNETDNDRKAIEPHLKVYTESKTSLKSSVIQKEDNKNYVNQNNEIDNDREAVEPDQKIYTELVSTLKTNTIENEDGKNCDNQDNAIDNEMLKETTTHTNEPKHVSGNVQNDNETEIVFPNLQTIPDKGSESPIHKNDFIVNDPDTHPDTQTHIMDLETAAITIQKVFRNFLFKSKSSTVDEEDNMDSNSIIDNVKKDENNLLLPNNDRRALGISRMDTVLQTVNEEKSLSLSTEDSSTLSSAATLIQAHVRGFLVRNKLNSNKTSSNSNVKSDPSKSSVEEETQQQKKTVLNIQIIPDGHLISRDESLMTSVDLPYDGSPVSSINLHPLGYDKSERRKQLKREDAFQSITPPSNNSGKSSESVQDVIIEKETFNKSEVLPVEIENEKTESGPDKSIGIEIKPDTEEISKLGIIDIIGSDETDVVVTPFVRKHSQLSIEKVSLGYEDRVKLLHTGEFHDAVLPTKVLRGDSSVVREFKNVLVYFLLWNNA